MSLQSKPIVKAISLLAAAGGLIGAAPAATPAKPPPPSIGERLAANRHTLQLSDGKLSGDGAALLAVAVNDARIVALGEDHLTREVPAFAAALCDLMAPELAATVVEAGPVATAEVARSLRAPDRLARMAAFNARYHNGIAFLDTRADNDFAAHCAAVARNPAYRTIGIDQEFVGSAGLLIDRILATPLSPAARRVVVTLRADERRGADQAKASGDPSTLLLLADSASRIAAARAAIERGGNAEAKRLIGGLAESQMIYAKNSSGAKDSNLVRALLMKRQYAATAPARGKILMKFGDWHLYKGVNPLGERDIGNFVAEQSDVAGRPSLHILMLGVRGVHASFGGYYRPLGREPFKMTDDKDYHWLADAVQAQASTGWTLFDLRPLRHVGIASLSPDWKRAIDGYDLLLLVPEFTPSDLIGDEAGGAKTRP